MLLRFAALFLSAMFLAAPAIADDDVDDDDGSPSAGIKDNSFLLEEAYNQDPGVVQHCVTLRMSTDRESPLRREILASFTQEWPLATQRHQLSYVLPFSGDYVKPRKDFQYASQNEGIGDVQLNYRYAILYEDPERPGVTPRVSLILPTGDEARGNSTGELGYQTALPVSKEFGKIALHGNIGMTFTPGVSAQLPTGIRSRKTDLIAFNAGGSVILLASNRIQPMLEVVTEWADGIESTGLVTRTQTTLVSPGARVGFDMKSGAQMVLGAATPIGANDDSPPFGVFLYLSYEHRFARR